MHSWLHHSLHQVHNEKNKMHFSQAILGLGLSASLAAGAAVASQAILNVNSNCPENVYVVYSNNQYKSATKTLTSGESGFRVVLSGEGIWLNYI